MKIFVTVGTTKFDSLIQTVFTGAVQKALSDKKYTQMVVQFGRSDCFDELNTTLDTSELKLDLCEKFSLRPDIIEYIKQADLIIGHAGAGTCLEVLSMEKPMIVVINEDLMGNHQTELAERLAQDNHLAYCTCKTLAETIKSFDKQNLVPYPKGNPQLLSKRIDQLMGI